MMQDLPQRQSDQHAQGGEERGQRPLESALANADHIAARLRHHRLALFLDYDGTLTPIVRRPEDATLSDEMRALLSRLAQYCTVAIVSGRDRQNAEDMVQVDNLVYAGSHGFDIRGPRRLTMQHEGARAFLPELEAAERQLRQRLTSVKGAHIERKKFAIAVHYREVADGDDVQRVEKAVDDVCREMSGLRKKGGKKIFELQPDVEWDKGRAVLWLVQALGLDAPDVVIMYIGDDVTDEDAFRALRHHDAGIGIRVAAPGSCTDAAYYLRDCDEVQQFLQSLLAIFRAGRVEE